MAATGLRAIWRAAKSGTRFVLAWVRLRRPPKARQLGELSSPDRFIRAAAAAAGGYLTVAAALLSREDYKEGCLALLLTRCVDAFEDLSKRREQAAGAVRAAMDYISGASDVLPSVELLAADDERSAVDLALAAQLPMLVEQLKLLDGHRRGRILNYLEQVAQAMHDAAQARARGQALDWRLYGNRVMGRAVSYAAELLRLEPSYTEDVYLGTGRVLQNVNNLRDLELDRRRNAPPYLGSNADVRKRIFVESVPDLPMPFLLLNKARFGPVSRERGALAFVAATAIRFLLRELGLEVSIRDLGRPLLLALLCVVDGRRYRRFLAAVEHQLIEAVPSLIQLSGAFPTQRPVSTYSESVGNFLRLGFERHLTNGYREQKQAESLWAVASILRAGSRLLEGVVRDDPSRQGLLDSADRASLIAADLCILAGLWHLKELSLEVLAGIGSWMSATAEQVGQDRDDGTEFIRFLSRSLADERGLSQSAREQHVDWHVAIGRALTPPDGLPQRRAKNVIIGRINAIPMPSRENGAEMGWFTEDRDAALRLCRELF